MRHKYMGIMVGIGTVLADDPMLNVRVPGLKSPTRIICDSNLRIPIDSNIVKTAKDIRTIVVCANMSEKKFALEEAGITVVQCSDENDRIDLKNLMILLGTMGIDSILLEGGGTLNYSALRAGIVNEVQMFIAPKIFGGTDAKSPVEGLGVELPAEGTKMKYKSMSNIGDDVLIRYIVEEAD